MCLWCFPHVFQDRLPHWDSSSVGTRTRNCPMPQFYHGIKNMEEAEQNNFAMFPLMFFVVLTTSMIKTVALKNEAEIVCSVRRRWKRQDYSFLSTLIGSNENYLLNRQKKHLFCFSCLISLILLCSPVFSEFFLFFSSFFFSCIVNQVVNKRRRKYAKISRRQNGKWRPPHLSVSVGLSI